MRDGRARGAGVTVLVVGAGLTGLVAAHRLRRLGAEVDLLEAAPRAGGVVQTTREDGWLLEHGPDAFHADSPALAPLLQELGLAAEVVRAPALDRYVLRRRRLAALPRGPLQLLTTRALPVAARLRLLREPFVPPSEGEESVDAFVRRRLGDGAADLADAFVTGVYAGDPTRLSADEAFPTVRAMEREHGSMFAALGAKKGSRGSLASFPLGLQRLVDVLAEEARPRTGVAVEALARVGERWKASTTGGEVAADRVVVALPPARAAKLVPGAAWPLPREAPIAVLGLGFREKDARMPKGYGYLAPASSRHFPLGAVFASRVFPGRAPPGHVLFRVMLGGVRHPERAWLPAEDLVAGSVDALKSAGLVKGAPVWSRVVRAGSIPQLDLGHAAFRAAVAASEIANPGLLVAGWGHRGVSVESVVADAERTARRAAAR